MSAVPAGADEAKRRRAAQVAFARKQRRGVAKKRSPRPRSSTPPPTAVSEILESPRKEASEIATCGSTLKRSNSTSLSVTGGWAERCLGAADRPTPTPAEWRRLLPAVRSPLRTHIEALTPTLWPLTPEHRGIGRSTRAKQGNTVLSAATAKMNRRGAAEEELESDDDEEGHSPLGPPKPPKSPSGWFRLYKRERKVVSPPRKRLTEEEFNAEARDIGVVAERLRVLCTGQIRQMNLEEMKKLTNSLGTDPFKEMLSKETWDMAKSDAMRLQHMASMALTTAELRALRHAALPRAEEGVWSERLQRKMQSIRNDSAQRKALAKQCRAWCRERKQTRGETIPERRARSPVRDVAQQRTIWLRRRKKQCAEAKIQALKQYKIQRAALAELYPSSPQGAQRRAHGWCALSALAISVRKIRSILKRKRPAPYSPALLSSPRAMPRSFTPVSVERVFGSDQATLGWTDRRVRWAEEVLSRPGFWLRCSITMRIRRKTRLVTWCIKARTGIQRFVVAVANFKRKVLRCQRAVREHQLLRRARLELWVSDWMRVEDGLRRELLAGRNVDGVRADGRVGDTAPAVRPVWVPVGHATTHPAAGHVPKPPPVPHDTSIRRSTSPRRSRRELAQRVVVLPPTPEAQRDLLLQKELDAALREWGSLRAAHHEKVRFHEHQMARYRVYREQALACGAQAEDIGVMKKPVQPKMPLWRILLARDRLRQLVVGAAKDNQRKNEEKVRAQLASAEAAMRSPEKKRWGALKRVIEFGTSSPGASSGQVDASPTGASGPSPTKHRDRLPSAAPLEQVAAPPAPMWAQSSSGQHGGRSFGLQPKRPGSSRPPPLSRAVLPPPLSRGRPLSGASRP